jgi:hypothetical protein
MRWINSTHGERLKKVKIDSHCKTELLQQSPPESDLPAGQLTLMKLSDGGERLCKGLALTLIHCRATESRRGPSKMPPH